MVAQLQGVVAALDEPDDAMAAEMREQMEADRKERAANPITTGAKAQNLGNGANVVQFQPPPSSG